MRHLPQRVHAGVGPPGAPHHRRRLGRDPRQRRLQRALHARMRRLALPAGEGASVVFDLEGIAGHDAEALPRPQRGLRKPGAVAGAGRSD